MREIKFRGKRIDNGEWVYGAFVPDALETPDNDLITWGFIRRYNRDIGKMETIEVARESVGQYTGLCDKNGNEIYEGDILRYSDGEILGVAFDNKTAQFTTKTRWLWTIIDVCEVIGNIHDNPELLEVKDV